MSADNKPGYDTLVFFWFAIFLWVVGTIAIPLGLALQANGTLGVNAHGLSILNLVSIGCFDTAGIFSIVVTHKIIAMLIYLVHQQR